MNSRRQLSRLQPEATETEVVEAVGEAVVVRAKAGSNARRRR